MLSRLKRSLQILLRPHNHLVFAPVRNEPLFGASVGLASGVNTICVLNLSIELSTSFSPFPTICTCLLSLSALSPTFHYRRLVSACDATIPPLTSRRSHAEINGRIVSRSVYFCNQTAVGGLHRTCVNTSKTKRINIRVREQVFFLIPNPIAIAHEQLLSKKKQIKCGERSYFCVHTGKN